MIQKILIPSVLVLLLFTACASNNGANYDGNSYKQIKTSEFGVVVRTRPIVISDSGSGRATGSVIGSVAGSVAGYHSNHWLISLSSTLIGALAGGAIGSEIARTDGSELTVELDDARRIIIVVERDDIVAGDRIEIIKAGAKVEQVNKLE